MSNSMHIAVTDPRINLKDDKLIHVVNDGPSSSTYQIFQPNNQNSTSSSIYQINPPSTKVGVNRYVRQKVEGSFLFTGSNLIPADVTVALRPWPLASIMSSCQLQINNANIAYSQQNTFIPAFSRVCNPVTNQVSYQSGTAAAPDILNNYRDMVDLANGPLSNASDTANGFVSRSRTEQITGINFAADGTSFVVSFSITEPILLAPFTADTNQVEALYGVSQMNLVINWANLHKLFSIATTNTAGPMPQITQCNPSFSYQALLINYVSPAEDTITASMPTQVYNCPSIQLYTNQTITTVPAPIDAVVTSTGITPQQLSIVSNATTNTITLPRCPRLAIIWVSDIPAVALTPVSACTIPDRIYPITALTVNAYNKSSLLAGATAEQLYEMSVAAGLNATQSQFLGRPCLNQMSGSDDLVQNAATFNSAPVVVDFANLSLPPGIAPGVDVQTQLQFTLSFGNNLFGTASAPSQDLSGYQVNLLLITDGYLVNSQNGSSEWITGGMTTEDVKRARHSSRGQFNEIMHRQTETTLIGGSFWDTLKNIGKSALSVVAPIASMVAPEFAPVIGMASQLAGAGKMSKAHTRSAAHRGYY